MCVYVSAFVAVLLGELPNVYVYAANNPSESIVAKRRGYGTIVSHNVPPYGRAGAWGGEGAGRGGIDGERGGGLWLLCVCVWMGIFTIHIQRR